MLTLHRRACDGCRVSAQCVTCLRCTRVNWFNDDDPELAPRVIELPGALDYDAISPNGRILYVAEHVDADGGYQVRAVDLPAGTMRPQVIVDGKPLNVTGQVTCTVNGANTNIGIGDAENGIGAVVSNDNPPIVHAVGLGSVNGVTLGYSDAAPGQEANAGAAVNGKTYAIKGTATGADMTNPQQPKQAPRIPGDRRLDVVHKFIDGNE